MQNIAHVEYGAVKKCVKLVDREKRNSFHPFPLIASQQRCAGENGAKGVPTFKVDFDAAENEPRQVCCIIRAREPCFGIVSVLGCFARDMDIRK